MSNRALVSAAETAFEARLDRDFGDGWLITVVGDAIADGIEALRGSHDARCHDEDIDAFLGPKLRPPALAAVKASVAELTGDELREDIIADMGHEYVEDLASLVGPVERLGRSDSSGFAVMVAGSIDVSVVRRNGYFATFENGDDTDEPGLLSPRRAEGDDPAFREARLAVAERFAGLSHVSVSIPGEDELDPELRDITFSMGTWQDSYHDRLRRNPERIEQLVDKHIGRFIAATHLSAEPARERLRTVIQFASFETETERDIVWDAWRRLRAY